MAILCIFLRIRYSCSTVITKREEKKEETEESKERERKGKKSGEKLAKTKRWNVDVMYLLEERRHPC